METSIKADEKINIDPKILTPYPTNSKIHSDESIKRLADSMKEVGFNRSVSIDEDNVILAGHKSVLAAILNNMDEIPVYKLHGRTEVQKKAFVIAENKHGELSEWDFDKLKIEIQALDELDFDLDVLGFDDIDDYLFNEVEGLTDEDSVPDVPDEPITKRGDVWLLENHRVMCGDSTNVDDVEKLLNGRTIDLIFTDPPYGVSYADKNEFLNAMDKGNSNQEPIKNDHMNVEETGQLWADTFSLWAQHLSDYSSYYIASPQGGDLFLMMMMMNENGMPLKHTIIWNKNNHVLGRCDYNYKHEPILYGWNNRHKFYGKGEFKQSVWNIDKPLKNDLHPTMKPVALVENCIKNSSSNNQIVGDMFLGSGTSVIAAEKNNRLCYGMELSEAYCDVIVKRWEEYTGKKAVLESQDKVAVNG